MEFGKTASPDLLHHLAHLALTHLHLPDPLDLKIKVCVREIALTATAKTGSNALLSVCLMIASGKPATAPCPHLA